MSTAASAVKLEFARRANVSRTRSFIHKRWRSRCGGYQVQQITSKLEKRTVFYAQRLRTDLHFWDVISQHRTYERAEAACRKLARQMGESS